MHISNEKWCCSICFDAKCNRLTYENHGSFFLSFTFKCTTRPCVVWLCSVQIGFSQHYVWSARLPLFNEEIHFFFLLSFVFNRRTICLHIWFICFCLSHRASCLLIAVNNRTSIHQKKKPNKTKNTHKIIIIWIALSRKKFSFVYRTFTS